MVIGLSNMKGGRYFGAELLGMEALLPGLDSLCKRSKLAEQLLIASAFPMSVLSIVADRPCLFGHRLVLQLCRPRYCIREVIHRRSKTCSEDPVQAQSQGMT